MIALFRRLLHWLRCLFWNREMEITILGLQNSGKTTFVNLLSTGEFCAQSTATVGFNMRKITKDRVTIKVWDIGGQPRFRNMWERYCRGADAILFMVDSADIAALEDSTEELHALTRQPQLASIPILVLGNKNDLPDTLSDVELIEGMNLDSIEGREVCCYSISCKEKNNIDVTLRWLIAHAKHP